MRDNSPKPEQGTNTLPITPITPKDIKDNIGNTVSVVLHDSAEPRDLKFVSINPDAKIKAIDIAEFEQSGLTGIISDHEPVESDYTVHLDLSDILHIKAD